jgi:DNA-binding NarL/FixJ family response regulator
MGMDRVRVLVADDDYDARGLLQVYVQGEPELDLVGAAADADGAIELAREHRPDTALLDVNMPGGGGVRAAREIRRISPETSIIAVSALDDRNTVLEMLEAGAISYLVKGASREQIIDTVRRALDAHKQLG